VDGSALLEARQRDKAVLRIAGMRVGYLHQRLLWIIGAVFDVSGEPSDVGGALRELHRASIDLTATMPAVVPARTRLVRAMESLAQFEEALAVAVGLGTQTAEAGRFEQLDAALRSNHFYAWLKGASLTPRILDEGSVLANGAADALDAVQTQFRFFANRGGASWRYGQLPWPALAALCRGESSVDAVTGSLTGVLGQAVEECEHGLVEQVGPAIEIAGTEGRISAMTPSRGDPAPVSMADGRR
jgi:hypothetical protein